MRQLVFTLLTLTSCAAMAAAEDRPQQPTRQTDPACGWVWREGEGLSLWTESCKLATGHWHVRWEKEMQGFSLWVDDQRQVIVAQRFDLEPGAALDSLLPQLRQRALIADEAECVFQPAAIMPAPRTIQQFEIKPVGEALKRFEALPEDEVPEPPCGEYGWGAHGTRWFQTDLRHPVVAIYLNIGQDGTFIAPETVVVGN